MSLGTSGPHRINRQGRVNDFCLAVFASVIVSVLEENGEVELGRGR
jgi:hypothetical protein